VCPRCYSKEITHEFEEKKTTGGPKTGEPRVPREPRRIVLGDTKGAWHSFHASETKACPQCGGMGFTEAKGVEVGNIFKLGTKYSAPFDLKYKDQNGQEQTVLMGCYGIGPSRLMGTIVETHHDKQGIIWPESVAPFKVHLIAINNKQSTINNKIKETAEKIEADMEKAGIEVLYDDRPEMAPGAKFAEADLIGIPYRLVISAKTLDKDSVELKKRNEEKAELIKLSKVIGIIK